jgi:glycosyltransferase involved in cell wall biosynthesis
MTGPDTTLRVTLDVSAVPARPAGAGRYTLELARALGRRPDVDLVTVTRRTDAARWRGVAPELAALAPGHRPLRLAWEQAILPVALRRLGPDVHHGPHYTMPLRARVPVVVSVHDCTFFDHPEWHERSKVLFFRWAIGQAARRAAVLVCGSATTAARLREVCPVSAPVLVAPYGVDGGRFGTVESSPGADAVALAALGLAADRPFVAFLGTIEPRKGVASLVRAFDRVAPRHPDARLVLAGQVGWGTEDVERALAAAGCAERVVRVGYVPDGAIPALLRRATVVAYPSLEEGGGLPALEALACGAPLITTSGTAMEEMAAGAAVLVAPGDDGALAAALDEALSQAVAPGAPRPPALEGRRQRGLEVARARTWEAAAEVHVEAYRMAHERRAP